MSVWNDDDDDDDDDGDGDAEIALQKLLRDLELPLKPREITGINFKARTVSTASREQRYRCRSAGSDVVAYRVPAWNMAALGDVFARYLHERGFLEDAQAVTQGLARYLREEKSGAQTNESKKKEEEQTMSEEKKERQAADGLESVGQRLKRALSEGVRRAPVEVALEEGQAAVVKMLLAGFKGSRHEREAAKKFLIWFFSTSAGQAAIAGAIAAIAPLVAGALGKGGPAVQRVADEFGARGATILVREGGKAALSAAKPVLGIFARLFEAEEQKSIGSGTADALFGAFAGASQKKTA